MCVCASYLCFLAVVWIVHEVEGSVGREVCNFTDAVTVLLLQIETGSGVRFRKTTRFFHVLCTKSASAMP